MLLPLIPEGSTIDDMIVKVLIGMAGMVIAKSPEGIADAWLDEIIKRSYIYDQPR
jgi:hypothetical protein